MTIDKYNYNDEPSGRVDTLAMALDKCNRLEKEKKRLRDFLLSIQYETAVLGGKKRDLEKTLNKIDCLCDWALRPEEMRKMREMEKELEK